MERNPTGNIFEAVHERITAMKDKMRADQTATTMVRRRHAKAEAVENGFDRPAIKLTALEDDEIPQ